MSGEHEDPSNSLRKYRKKLRQIEILEQIDDRALTNDEKEKIARKEIVRKKIKEFLQNKKEEFGLGDYGIGSRVTEELLIDLPNDTKDEQIDFKDNQSRQPDFQHLLNEEKGQTGQDLRTNLQTSEFRISVLSGHNDLIHCVALDQDLLLSCSRDTTVKVWDAQTGEQLKSLSGHTSSVMAVVLLSPEQGKTLLDHWQMKDDHRIGISGGHDCTLRFWSVLEGIELKSVYTYNSILCMAVDAMDNRLVIGTDGGKIELWDMLSLVSQDSLPTDEDSIMQIKVEDKFFYASTSDGIILVLVCQENELRILFSSEDLHGDPNYTVRNILALELHKQDIYFGDNGINIKLMDWKSGDTKKIRNHHRQCGATDALCRIQNLLFASSYDMDTGRGSINVFEVPSNQYLGSIDDDETPRILSLAVSKTAAGHLRIVTAGTKLKIWESMPITSQRQRTQSSEPNYTKMIRVLGFTMDLDTETESSASGTDDSESGYVEQGRFVQTYFPEQTQHHHTFWYWCNIL